MIAILKKFKKNKFSNFSPNYNFSAPPYNMLSTFQPGAYYRMYHRVQAEKMKRSYEWVKLMSRTEQTYSLVDIIKIIQEGMPRVKTYIKDGVLNVIIGEYNEEILEEFPLISQIIEEGTLKVELGDDRNTKIVNIDVKGY